MEFSLQSVSSWFSSFAGGETLWMIIMFILVLSVLVFFHELGHYLAARSVGVKVTSFSIGFGKELFGWNDKNGTRWKFSLIPLGGYVQLFGDQTQAAEDFSEEDKKQAFVLKNVWQRIWVVFAGPLANFVLAVVFLAALMFTGEKVLTPEIGTVIEGSVAEEVGLEKGDIVLAVNDTGIFTWDDIVASIAASNGSVLNFVVERNYEAVTIPLTPKIEERVNLMGETVRIPFVGISPSGTTFSREHGFVDSLALGVTKTYDITARILDGIGKMIMGEVSAKNIGGPVLIAEIAGDAGSQGLYALVMFMVIISINLGLINLFPIPVLDGGHLMFYFIEAIRGKPLGEKAQEIGFKIGYGMIMLLMFFAIGNDLVRVADKFTKEESAPMSLSAPLSSEE